MAMKKKRHIRAGLDLAQNFKIAKAEAGLRMQDIINKSGASKQTCWRLLQRPPELVTDQVLKVGRVLGFSKSEIEDAIIMGRVNGHGYKTRRERFYLAVGELIGLFEGKFRGKEVD